MHPLLKVLDIIPGESLDISPLSPHPILAVAPAPPLLLPGIASLGLTGLFITALALGLLDSPSLGDTQALASQSRSVSIVLSEAGPQEGAQRNPLGGGIRGAGIPVGTSSRDPALLQEATPPSEDFNPTELRTLPSQDRSLQLLNPELPLKPGGNGLALGAGSDATKGHGSGTGSASAGSRPDYRVVPIREVRMFHRLRHGEVADERDPIRVRVVIGADGVPIEVTVLSGPAFLQEEAVATARQWRFDPLERHGLEAPQTVFLNFYPVITS